MTNFSRATIAVARNQLEEAPFGRLARNVAANLSTTIGFDAAIPAARVTAGAIMSTNF